MSFLYTVVPAEEIWEDVLDGAATQPVMVEAAVNGVPVLVRQTADGQVVERLLTTNPYTFLDPALAPGTLLHD